MAIGSYRYYRLVFTELGYVAINSIGLYETNNGTGTNRLTGATATASSSYGSQTPDKAIDASSATYWESGFDGPDEWISFDLGAAYTIKSLKITSTVSAGSEVPRNFNLQVSTNGTTWVTVGYYVFSPPYTSQTNKVQALDLHVSGNSTISGGAASQKVIIANYSTGELLAAIVPSSSGAYEWRFESSADVLVTHIGPSGYRPLSDGPITPGT